MPDDTTPDGLRRIPVDLDRARQRLDSAGRSLALGQMADFPDLGLTLAYDAIRKAAAALLEAHGLRAATRGGAHAVTIREAARILAGTDERAATRLGELGDVLRRLRNTAEYGIEESITADDAKLAIATARELLPTLETAVASAWATEGQEGL